MTDRFIHVEFFERGMRVRNNTTKNLTAVYDEENGRIDIHDLTLPTTQERVTPLHQIIVKFFLESAAKDDFMIIGNNGFIVKMTKKYPI